MQIEEHVALAPLTTFQIGGSARYLARAQDVKEVCAALSFAKEKNLKIFVLGGGSNVLVSDKGFDGLVIKIEIAGVEIQENKLFIAGAGESWDEVVARAVGEGLWGLENLSGIPGTVGGAVVQNIGAYGAAVSETLAWVEVFDTETGQTKNMQNGECLFDYRDSIFKHKSNLIVLRAAFAVCMGAQPNLSYKDLSERFGGLNAENISLLRIREAVLDIRKAKFPDLSVEGTAGSFFKNPILSKSEADALKLKYSEMPLFEMPETKGIKVPLAWVLDRVLHMKSVSVGGARLFEKQPLVVAAKRGTYFADVLALKEAVEKKVLEETKIKIEPEVKIIGEK